MASLNTLPEEVQLMIMSYLQVDPPSTTEVRRQIEADTFDRAEQPLKSLAATCRKWKRLTQPELVKHLKLDLGWLLKPARRPQCDSCDCMSSKPQDCGYTADIAAAPDAVQRWCTDVSKLLAPGCRTSLLVVCKEPISCQANKNGLELAVHYMWKHIFETIDPKRIVIQANHVDLLLLLGGITEHAPTLAQQREFRVLELDCKQELGEYKVYDHAKTDFGLASKSHGLRATMLHARPWAHIGLNEGIGMVSSTVSDFTTPRARGACLVDRLFPPCCFQQETAHSHRWQHLRDEMSFLDCFSLTAPHAPENYVPSLRSRGGVHQFQFLRELRLSLLPQPVDVDIYDLPSDEQVDWWHSRIYDALRHYCQLRVDMLAHFSDPYWRLRKVICYDDEVLQRYPVFIRYFEQRVAEMRNRDDSRPEINWARVWEIVPAEVPGGLRFTAHA